MNVARWRQLMNRWLVAIGSCSSLSGCYGSGLAGWAYGRLPGDIVIERGNVHFYFPVVTGLIISVIVSVVLSFILWLLNR
jgi:hypothetical protein